jgi:hypothetical protein
MTAANSLPPHNAAVVISNLGNGKLYVFSEAET